ELDLKREKYNEALARVKKVRLPSGGSNETKIAAQNLKAMVRKTATENHERFRKNNSRASLAVAEAFYSVYLERFLGDSKYKKEVPELRMYLAEVKRELGKAREASDLYRQVIESRDKRYAKEAGSLWTASLAESIRTASQDKTASSRKEPSEL